MTQKKKSGKLAEAVEEPAPVVSWHVRSAAESASPGLADTAAVVGRIRAGLPFAEFEALRDLLDISNEELAEKVGISRSTLARRKRSGRLDKDPSDKVVRFARIFALAREVFEEDEPAARAWLKSPQRALGFSTALDFADTEAGAREVERLLGRVEHGVYS